eukprot:scaffold2182_cov118-Isochrysis_galbana.AAC.16
MDDPRWIGGGWMWMCISNLNLQPSTCRLPPAAVPRGRRHRGRGRGRGRGKTSVGSTSLALTEGKESRRKWKWEWAWPELELATHRRRERCSEVRRRTGIPGFHYA